MTLTYRVGVGGAGTVDLGDVVFLGEMPGFIERADGTVGHSGVAVQDEGGTLNLTGLNKFVVEESASSNVRIFTGISTERGISRGDYTTGAGRVWDTNVADSNAYLHLRVIRDGNHGNRPAETDVQRIAWLLDEVLYAGHVQNGTGGLFGANGPTAGVIASPRNLDAADYRNQHADDVLADIGPPGNRRFFTYWDPTLEAVCLFYGLDSENLGDSTLRISNVASDADSVTFAPFQDASLTRDPADVFGGINYTYRHGTIYREDPDTIGSFLDRSVAVSNDRVGLASTASTFVDRLLDKASTERDTVTCTILIPKAQVNLVIAGQRIQGKFSHLPDLSSFTYRYVVSRRVWQEVASAEFYYVTLELSDKIGGLGTGGGGGGGPFVPGTSTETPLCIGGAYPITPSQHFTPYGPPGTSNADGWVSYAAGAPFYAPNPNAASLWGFPTYNGPAGSDYAGDCTNSGLHFVLVGAGTLVVNTALSAAGARRMRVAVRHMVGAGTTVHEDYDFDAGATITVVIPSDAADNCVHSVVFSDGVDACGKSWGWSGADWTSGTAVANTPTTGQQVTESAIGDGSDTTFGTNYAYYPRSLQVTVGGVAVVPTETDPAAGTFSLPFAPPAGTQILITYKASNGTLLATGNTDTPISTTPTIPAATLPAAGGLDGLTDVVITGAAVAQRLRFDGTNWVNTAVIWQPLTNGDTTTPELIFASGDVIMVEV